MKICPTCQTRYDQGESFCPSDGTELVQAREMSPGRLSGSELDGRVHLDEVIDESPAVEHYDGRLTETDEPVRVTVISGEIELDEEAVRRGRRLAEVLEGDLPDEVLGVRAVGLDRPDANYVAERSPSGTDLRSMLDDQREIDWRRATRLTIRIGRVLEAMAARGIYHGDFHAGAIHVSEGEDGTVRVGDWLQGALLSGIDPRAAAEGDGPFPFHAPYLAPEVVEGEDVDERSLVYSLAMLLYELILGQPPFASKTAEDTLKRHLHETPLKLAIAAGGEDLHPELDDILGVMWDKQPEERFDSVGAAVGALGSLLSEPLDEVAPPLDGEVGESIETAAETADTIPDDGRPVPADDESAEESPSEADDSSELEPAPEDEPGDSPEDAPIEEPPDRQVETFPVTVGGSAAAVAAGAGAESDAHGGGHTWLAGASRADETPTVSSPEGAFDVTSQSRLVPLIGRAPDRGGRDDGGGEPISGATTVEESPVDEVDSDDRHPEGESPGDAVSGETSVEPSPDSEEATEAEAPSESSSDEESVDEDVSVEAEESADRRSGTTEVDEAPAEPEDEEETRVDADGGARDADGVSDGPPADGEPEQTDSADEGPAGETSEQSDAVEDETAQTAEVDAEQAPDTEGAEGGSDSSEFEVLDEPEDEESGDGGETGE
ncbi:MAG: protein kinase, partial [Bradymonadaceae bacterium]